MAQAPPGRRPGKQAILREVYETNRTGTPPPRRRRPAPTPPPPERGGAGRAWVAVAAALAVALAAVGAWALARPEPAPPSPPAADAGALEDPAPPRPAGSGGVADVLGLDVRTIVVDPGHGGYDPGAVGPGRLEEKAVTLDVARRLRDRLERGGDYRVLLTRDDDRAVSLAERVAFADRAGADLYVSVHVNALPDPALAPVETYYFGVEADSTARALARAGNAGGGFSVAEFNAAVRRAGMAVKLQESRALAESVQRALVDQGGLVSRADWGAKPAPFAVLLHTEAPAILAEITALSNPAEEDRLRTAAYRDAIAAALEAGVLTYLQGSPPPAAADAPREEDR
ncbi:N-acetylmuramoyl-L-alanine amidase family protein [Rubrivirga litoralis]|uniref:N-acetylmuramoyl-L-alanine amidase n=1 Tax=Rubrivirga litoralis TaxID=3075598 RepID=A0ABU3BNV9_9BACT|nr:N-acetylmuramoyl-L-alanine amidase [Rubrivirga sp. F394]MDT0630948.1 N-acetylmuramoyl-L-alanine amidase [Rubrivirga sp. F394]